MPDAVSDRTGVYALAEVAKEGYPDCKSRQDTIPRLMTDMTKIQLGTRKSEDSHSATYIDAPDSSHPYFDEKTKQDDPTWYMVDVRFIRRLPNPPTLALVKYLASAGSIPDEVNYIGQAGWKAVREMQLVNRGRLSRFSF